MAIFNLQGGYVIGTQNISGGDMHIGVVNNHPDVIARLHQIRAALIQAQQQGHLPVQLATAAEEQIKQAAQQAEQMPPNKQTLLDHIHTAKSLLESVQAATGLVSGLAALAQAVQHIPLIEEEKFNVKLGWTYSNSNR